MFTCVVSRSSKKICKFYLTTVFRIRYASVSNGYLIELFLGEPFREDVGNLDVVCVRHREVGVAAHADFGKVDYPYVAADFVEHFRPQAKLPCVFKTMGCSAKRPHAARQRQRKAVVLISGLSIPAGRRSGYRRLEFSRLCFRARAFRRAKILRRTRASFPPSGRF